MGKWNKCSWLALLVCFSFSIEASGKTNKAIIGASATAGNSASSTNDAFNSVFVSNITEKTVTIKSEKISVKEALKLVKKQTGVDIIYDDATLKNVNLRLSLEKVPLEKALSVICTQAGVRYEIVENNCVLILPANHNSKNKTITGIVKDELGEPIIGASVMVKGTNYGTIADMDGRFMLSFPEKAGSKLVFSFVGMNSVEENLGNKRVFNVKLKSVDTILDEIVVVGYGTAKAKDLTGSVSRVSLKEIETAPMTANISGMLQGKAAGVNVMISSASPTSPVSVIIRGVSSLSGDGQPLWIIDGVPQYSSGLSGDVSNTLYNLNLNDVQSIDILKDASATAIYGSRAANGVVIVTTKSGAEGMKPTIEFTSRVGWQFIDSNKIRSCNADEYRQFSRQAIIDEAYRAGGQTYFTQKFIDSDKFKQLNTSQWNKSDLEDMFLPNAYFGGNDNYWDMMTQNAMTQDYNISMRGGSKANSYYASFNYKDQDGVVKGSNTQYFGARFNFEGKIREVIKLGFNMDASSRQANMKDDLISSIIDMRPDYPAYNEDGTVNTIDSYITNPVLKLLNINKSASRNFNGSLFLEYNILPYLKFRTTGNISYANIKAETHTRATTENGINSGTARATQNYTYVWDNLLTFYKTMGKHDVQALIGHSVEKNWTDGLSASGSRFPDDEILTDLGSAAVKSGMSTSEDANALVSAFARLQYKYNNRYLLTATYRMDGSSRFGKDSRWGYFPSGALGWIMTEEEFMENLKPHVSYLKLRASIGLTGSQNLGNYDFVTLMGSNVYNRLPGVVPSSMGNSLLQWEAQRQIDLGLDYGFFDDRIRGSVGWYHKYVDNLIYDKPVPTSSSFSSVSQNVGAISNRGFEFDIHADLIKLKDLTWEINLNIATNKGKLEKLNGITKFIGGGANANFKLVEGSELGTFYGYVDAGRFYMNNEEVYGLLPIDPTTGRRASSYRSTRTEIAGDMYVVDLNGDGKITADGDRTYLGNANPDFFGGFGTTLYWKGLMANLTFTYSVGGKRYWSTESGKMAPNVYNAPNFILENWGLAGENAKYPNVSLYGYGENSVFTNRWLHDASYLRLSTLNLSYRLPQKWFRSGIVQGIEATFQATNLFTITPYPGMDPQGNFSGSNLALYGFGYDYASYPAARTINVGLKFTFK